MSKHGSPSCSSASVSIPQGGLDNQSSTPDQTRPNANSSYTNPLPSIACLHLYAHRTGRYPKLGLFCDDDLEVDLGHSLSQPVRPSDRDENVEFVPAPAYRSAPKDRSRGAQLEKWEDFKSASENATWFGVKRAEPPLPVERVEKRDRTNTTEGSIPIVAGPDQTSTSRTSHRKYLIVEDSAEEGEGNDLAFSGQGSDHEYIPGSTRRAKCTTKVRRKEWKPSENGKGTNPPANSVGSTPEANTTIVKRSSAYNKRRNSTITEGTNNAILAASKRSTKKRKLVEDSADEAVDGLGKYPVNYVEDGSRSGGDANLIDIPGRTPNAKGKNLQHSRETPTGKYTSSKTGAGETATERKRSLGNKRHRVDATDQSSDISDDSDEEYNPGTKDGFKKSEINRFGQTSTSSNRWHKIEDLPRGADGSRLIASGTRSTISKSEVQETEDLSDLPNVVHENGGRYRCLACGKCTKSRGDMKRHLQSIQHQVKSYVCLPECLSTFTRKDSLKRHIENSHKGKIRIHDISRIAYRVQ